MGLLILEALIDQHCFPFVICLIVGLAIDGIVLIRVKIAIDFIGYSL